MKGRFPLLVMLVSSGTFLASLYLPWVSLAYPSPRPGSSGISSLLNLLSAGGFDRAWGLSSGFGGAAGLVAFGLFAAIALELAHGSGRIRLPLPTAAFALLFLSGMTALEVWNDRLIQVAYGTGREVLHPDIGLYLGLASAAIVFICAVGPRVLTVAPRVSVSAVVGMALTCALLASFVLPHLTFHVPHHPRGAFPIAYQLFSQGRFVQVTICLLACFSLPLWGRVANGRERLALTAAIAVLTAGFLAPLRSLQSVWPWELWLLLACAVALFALALLAVGRPRVDRPRLADVATVAAAVMFLAALFLRWETPECPQGACKYSLDGWLSGGSVPAIFTVIMLVGLLGYGRFWRELAVGTAIYVMAVGLEITWWGSLGYGAPLGFAAAALLLFYAVRGLRPIPQARCLVRLVPLAACLGFLSFIVGSMTRGIGATFAAQSPWHQSELALAATFLILRLLIRWSDAPSGSDETVLLPLALLAVTALDLIFARGFGISWEGWVSVFLCLVLALCGWVERYRGGLERFQIPEEIWRVDRISTGES